MKASYMISYWFVFAFTAYMIVSPRFVSAQPEPIIDMHLHALPANFNGPPPVTFYTGQIQYPGIDPQKPFDLSELIISPEPLLSPSTDKEVMQASLQALERYNIIAVTSGTLEYVLRWKAAAPERIIPALLFAPSEALSPDSLRKPIESGEIAVLGEVLTQYQGRSGSDPALEPYLAMAEELDVPVAIHVGMGPSGVAYLGKSKFRASLTNPLLLEEALLRHPRLRVNVMHAGWPMLDEMIHLLYSHPQVYVDVGIISWGIPRNEFYRYLRRLVEAGFGKRIMFGSDQMVWPQAIGIDIEAIQTADFLTDGQKQDIF